MCQLEISSLPGLLFSYLHLDRWRARNQSPEHGKESNTVVSNDNSKRADGSEYQHAGGQNKRYQNYVLLSIKG